MRQLYYTVQILLRGRGSNFIKLVSLTLGLLIGILLFSQIAYELSYENFYKDPENVALLRCRRVEFLIKTMTTALFALPPLIFGRHCRI